ncbi:hypothetical protein RB195_005369 [Necator americanus]|uniref:C2H2-type domain-containing protein n=1 Tax=Necator americanus TaxID=51031 RepID=A0ABR1BRI0_NECAM
MVSPVRGISSQTRSHVQINIYGTTVDALRSRGVDLERLLSSLGCRCVVMDVPELPSESTELVSVTSFQGCEDWINDITTRSGQTSATKEADVESEPQPYRVPHDHEINCCPIISELSADSFVDSKLFVNPKEDPASQTFPMKSCLVFDDAKLNSFCVGSESSSERKFGLRELEELPGSDTVISRMPRRRAPPPSFSPPEPREIKRRRKLKLAYGSRTVVRGDGTFECKIPGCGKILHFKQSCRRQGLDHVRSHFPKKTRRCKICDYSGNTNASVYNHHTSCHSSTPYPGPVAAETKEDLELLQRLFSQAFPEIPGIESYMSVIS